MESIRAIVALLLAAATVATDTAAASAAAVATAGTVAAESRIAVGDVVPGVQGLAVVDAAADSVATGAFLTDAVRPAIVIAAPAPGAIITTSDVLLELRLEPEDFDMKRHNLKFCVELLYLHGRNRQCYDHDLPWTARVEGLAPARVSAVATLESNTTRFNARGVPLPDVIATSQVSFRIADTAVVPPKMDITYPHPQEHLSTSQIDVAMRLSNFKADDGYFCATFFSHLGSDRESSFDECVVPNRDEIVVSVNFENGYHGVSARLYDTAGTPIEDPNAVTATHFRVSAPSTGADDSLADAGSLDLDMRVGSAAASKPDGVNRGAAGDLDTVHLSIMSVRSYDRYEEAFVMIKSILFNRRRPNPLHFHLIVDGPGRAFFAQRLATLRQPCLRVTFHDFNALCVRPNEAFLDRFNFSLSAHYSGHAGYCRLYLYDWFLHRNVSSVIAIESDQIFMQDVVDLWDEFARFPEQAAVGMPEMYKPWRDGRPQSPEAAASDGLVDVGAPYHGNGHIGGIIMLNFTRMRAAAAAQEAGAEAGEDGWMEVVAAGLHEYLARPESVGWNPQLNDQDIFNALFSVRPELIFTLPCQWNLQFHAFTEQMRVCDSDISRANCDEARRLGMFLCRRRPAVLHFMASSYKSKMSIPSYYQEFYMAMAKLDAALLEYDDLAAQC